MSRNGPLGQPGARAPARRSAADQDPYAPSSGWPTAQGDDPHQPGYQPHPAQHSQGYYFPQPGEPDGNPGYPAQPVSQSLPFDRLPPTAPAQWDPQQRDTGHYDLGSYLPAAGDARAYAQEPFQGSADGP